MNITSFRLDYDECIGCGTCAASCPQQAIDEGAPYCIRQRNCLHCGLCAENCPVQAIVRRGREDGTYWLRS